MTKKRITIKATPVGIDRAEKALTRLSFGSKSNFAKAKLLGRSTVTNFFLCRSIQQDSFQKICDELGLPWQEIADFTDLPELVNNEQPKPVENKSDANIDLDALVQEVRKKIKPIIQERCGSMRILDMSQPIGLNDIYTNVNILEKITGRRRKEISELQQECNSEDFERFGLSKVKEARLPGLEAVEKYTKLMILGKPGAGKSTFLKYLAIQCIEAKFHSEYVPIFITIKNFAEAESKPSLLEYIAQQFFNTDVNRENFASLRKLIEYSRALILLDGLDEVKEEDSYRILKEIRNFSEQFHNNYFIITCRIAARDYTFEKFTEVEVADFDNEQIKTFATNWFKNKAVKAESFIERLTDNYRILELASNPLLLTLLCLTFEESGDFPSNRSELYKEGIDALLKKWDVKRGIYREQVYKKLSIQRKEELLSKIAFATFERSDYFFKQTVAEQYILSYIRNLPDASTDLEALQIDSAAVLQSIEHHHGLLVARANRIYSFSHLTFHEYFTAREIVFGTKRLEDSLQELVSHITDYRWREVFLLAVGMLPSADLLLQLMKQQVDKILADDKLQQFLIWVHQKSQTISHYCKPVVSRVYYLCIEYVYGLQIFDITEYLELADLFGIIDFDLDYHLGYLDEDDHILDKNCYELLEYRFYESFSPNDAITTDINYLFEYPLEAEFKIELKQLQDELPNSNLTDKEFQHLWKAKSITWCKRLNNIMIKYRNIGHDWQFSTKQIELLQQYYDANLLLVNCLISDCYVSREVREEIENTLLLPVNQLK